MKTKKQSIALVGILALCTKFGSFAAGANAVSPYPDAKVGAGAEGIYARVCGYCHGANVGPLILGRELHVDFIRTMVRLGIGSMPAFRQSEISDAELGELAQWISKSAPRAGETGR
ncbi:c-type cytochrome [Pseudothauera rhizosphaerae]|uniref:Cytochrome c n=1 Tax=Pseudothauera rhizosphaerae TaxID=2565932 RepID=A0A4S4ALF4_9RHOO|nr:cytochrome c [Pseudothauera rhizosphaerae]THF60357.1 cytochrome c [Pseudothauera rhizosphaerae]